MISIRRSDRIQPRSFGPSGCSGPLRIMLGQALLLDLILRSVHDPVAPSGPERASEEDIQAIRALSGPGKYAADEFYRRYADQVFRFIYRRVGENREDAEDLTLETFMTAIKLARGYEGKSRPFVWLCAIAKVRLIDFHRRTRAGKRFSPMTALELSEVAETLAVAGGNGHTMEELLDRFQAEQIMDAALSLLTEEEHEVLFLRYVDGLSVREIALYLGRSERAVDSLLSRAKAKPRKLLSHLVRSDGEEA